MLFSHKLVCKLNCFHHFNFLALLNAVLFFGRRSESFLSIVIIGTVITASKWCFLRDDLCWKVSHSTSDSQLRVSWPGSERVEMIIKVCQLALKQGWRDVGQGIRVSPRGAESGHRLGWMGAPRLPARAQERVHRLPGLLWSSAESSTDASLPISSVTATFLPGPVPRSRAEEEKSCPSSVNAAQLLLLNSRLNSRV